MSSRLNKPKLEGKHNQQQVSRHVLKDIFSSISQVVEDPDQNVKNGSELLDRLLKDIVTESKKFDVVAFIPILRERMYARTKFVR